MNAGVWVPFGCTVNHDEARRARELPPDDMSWLRGKPAMWGSEYGSQLAVWYALFHGWGDIAYDFLRKKGNPGDLRQWTNEDKGETWDTVTRRQTWEELGARIIDSTPRYIVPAEYDLVTIGIDKQEADYVYEVNAWRGEQGHTVDYGRIPDSESLLQLVEAKWSRTDSKQLKPVAVLIDSGYRPSEVHAFVKKATQRGVPIRACRGSYGQNIAGYYLNRVNSKRSSNPGQWVTYVDTHSTQDWVDQHLRDGCTVFEASLGEHQDYLQQLINEGVVAEIDNHGQTKEHWNRLDTMIPNDYRDCKRYSFVGRLLAGKGATQSVQRPTTKADTSRLIKRPGGWIGGQR
jgi:phage terminase large subunit GpA-like protein